VMEALSEQGFESRSAEVTLIADTNIELDADGTGKVLKLLDTLDDNDDVQNVSSNLEIPDDFDPDAQ
jgi:transcriptional/translational regulatory protein YebC/TACO1